VTDISIDLPGLSSRSRLGERGRSAERPRILVVDDDAAVRGFVDRVLREAGYTTMVAANGPEALDLVTRGQALDLLVTDVMLPGMHGGELARCMRDRDPDLEVLYLTGYSDRLFKEKTIWEGEAFLEKPCTVNGLLEAVSRMLHGQLRPPAA
jgi:two-component system, cell cycle sensor histidine kinase and response regulator CckA